MNPLEALDLVAAAIEKAKPMIGLRYEILYYEHAFHCMPLLMQIDKGHILCTFNGSDLEKGLTTKQWNQLQVEIINLIDQGVLCPKQ